MLDTDTAGIFAKLDKLHVPTLDNLDIEHPRLMVLFSGPPGSGKSTLAKAISSELSGVRLENDAVRILLAANYPELTFDERGKLTYLYGTHLYGNLIKHVKNGLWIIDSSVDRRYEEITEFAHKHQLAVYLIALDIPEGVHRSRIIQGGGRTFSSLANYLRYMPQRRQEQAAFLASHKPDITLGANYDLKLVIASIATKLRTLG
jgi:predicted kinase